MAQSLAVRHPVSNIFSRSLSSVGEFCLNHKRITGKYAVKIINGQGFIGLY